MNQMDSYKPKSFWQKPEGTTGMVFAVALLAAIGYGLFILLPYVNFILSNLIYTIVAGLVLFALIYMILDNKVRTLVWYMYKTLMRTITSWFVTIDPVKILEVYVEHLRSSMEKMNGHIMKLKTEIRKLKDLISKNEKDMDNEFAMAKKAKSAGNEKQASLSVRQAERLKESNVRLQDLLTKLEGVYNMLMRVHENANYILQDTVNEVDLRKREYTALKAGHSAFRSAMSVIRGDSDKMELFNMSMERVAADVSTKIGEMERFIELSSDALDRVDLQNAVFEEEGFKSLEAWEQKSSLLHLEKGSGGTAAASSKSKYSDLF